MKNGKLVLWFDEISSDDVKLAGRKGVSLADLTRMGMNVPPGFVLTTSAYERFMTENDVGKEIQQYFNEFRDKDMYSHRVESVSKNIRRIVESTVVPLHIQEQLVTNYGRLCKKYGITDIPVSVRSSGPVSRPGIFETYLNVRGVSALLSRVVSCWASVFSPHAITTRAQKGMAMHTEPIAVVVQRMVNARSAGVLFTAHPISGDFSKVVIEGSWGLGVSIVQAEVAPDKFMVDKNRLVIEESTINSKATKVVMTISGTKVEAVPDKEQSIPCLNDDEIKELAKRARAVERYYGDTPQDIEWAVTTGLPFPENIYLVQARPIVGVSVRKRDVNKPNGKGDTDHILDLMIGRLYQ